MMVINTVLMSVGRALHMVRLRNTPFKHVATGTLQRNLAPWGILERQFLTAKYHFVTILSRREYVTPNIETVLEGVIRSNRFQAASSPMNNTADRLRSPGLRGASGTATVLCGRTRFRCSPEEGSTIIAMRAR